MLDADLFQAPFHLILPNGFQIVFKSAGHMQATTSYVGGKTKNARKTPGE